MAMDMRMQRQQARIRLTEKGKMVYWVISGSNGDR
jgi:hypothetical protein